MRRATEPLLLPAAGAMVLGLHVLAVGQVWRRLLLPAIGPLDAPPIVHAAASQSEAPATASQGQDVTFAHELRRRLAALRVLSEAIEVRTGHGDTDRLVDMLVRELHDLEQLEAAMLGGSRTDTLEDVDVLEIARAAAQTVGWARESEIKVQSTNRPLRIRSNPTMLRQALENLIDNAATCGTGAPVEVIVRFSVTRRLPGIEVLVADRGLGLGRAPAGRRSGGVGLQLVRKFVQEAGGRLWSHNREGGGAVFGVWLPAGRLGVLAGVAEKDNGHSPKANGHGARSNGGTAGANGHAAKATGNGHPAGANGHGGRPSRSTRQAGRNGESGMRS